MDKYDDNITVDEYWEQPSKNVSPKSKYKSIRENHSKGREKHQSLSPKKQRETYSLTRYECDKNPLPITPARPLPTTNITRVSYSNEAYKYQTHDLQLSIRKLTETIKSRQACFDLIWSIVNSFEHKIQQILEHSNDEISQFFKDKILVIFIILLISIL